MVSITGVFLKKKKKKNSVEPKAEKTPRKTIKQDRNGVRDINFAPFHSLAYNITDTHTHTLVDAQ